MRKFLPILAAFLFLSTAADAQTQPKAKPEATQAKPDKQAAKPDKQPAKPDPIIGSAKAPPPPREAELIGILQNARKQYLAARSIDGRKNSRMAMQSTLHNFWGLSHSAQDWVGVFKDSKKNPLGSRSVEIEIAPGVTIATSDNPAADGSYATMIKQFSPMGKMIDTFSIGDEVTFSAEVIGGVISSDDDMVLHPQMVAKFSKLQKIDGPPPVH